MEKVIASKIANALIPEAEMSSTLKTFLDAMGSRSAHSLVLNNMKKRTGGLWVGGTAILHEHDLTFRPNAMNKIAHEDDYTTVIPLADICEVNVRFGFVTKIIDLVTREGKFSIRCWGAEKFAALIRDQLNQ